jgi:hypothetical protein
VELPKDDPATFSLYIRFLYTRTVPSEEALEPHDRAKKETTDKEYKEELGQLAIEASNAEFIALSPFYVFCAKIQDTTTKDLAINAFVEVTVPRSHQPGLTILNTPRSTSSIMELSTQVFG